MDMIRRWAASVLASPAVKNSRIAIARAILKNAPILILDEATSASDPENQMEIDKAIQNLCKGKTVIVVAHRLSALKMCERVAVVENHTITCVGTHEEVRKNNAYYRKAWEDYETAGILLISWREASSMSEHDVLKKNRNFYIGVGGTVLEGLLSGSCLCCFTLSCSFCGRDNLT